MISPEESANQLLTHLQRLKAPIDLSQLAVYLRLKIVDAQLDDRLSAALLRDQRLVAVNCNHVLERKRFSVAHEMGHYILHKDDKFYDGVFQRSKHIPENKKQFEREANQFAAALLMPEKLVRASVENKTKQDQAVIIGQLATEFQVSIQAMSYRLLNLGLE